MKIIGLIVLAYCQYLLITNLYNTLQIYNKIKYLSIHRLLVLGSIISFFGGMNYIGSGSQTNV